MHLPLDNYRTLQAESKKLRADMRSVKLADEDIDALIDFVHGSNRLYDCLQVAYLSRTERKAFEDQLLLPPD